MFLGVGAVGAAIPGVLANSQALLVGGALFIWQMNAPYLLTGALLVTVALIIGWKATDRRCEARLA